MNVTEFDASTQPHGFRRHASRISGLWSYPEHRHSGFFELVYVSEGALRHTIEGVTTEQKRGHLALVRDRDAHALSGANLTFTNLQVSNLWLAKIEQMWDSQALQLGPLKRPAPLLAEIPAKERAQFESELERIENPPHHSGKRAIFSGFILNVFLRYFTEPTIFGFERKQLPDWLAQTILWIHRRRNQPVRVADVIEHANRCPEHVSRSFRKHFKMSPSQYLNRQRLDYAAELLANTNYPLLDICYSAGFDNPSYFHRLFKRTFGQQPNAYRKANSRLLH